MVDYIQDEFKSLLFHNLTHFNFNFSFGFIQNRCLPDCLPDLVSEPSGASEGCSLAGFDDFGGLF